MRRFAARLLAGALAALLAAGGTAAAERQVSVFAGQHVDNTWQHLFDFSKDLDYDDAWLLGLAVGKEWRRPGSRFSWGIEFQAVGQEFDGQYHIEFNLPFVIRYDIPQPLPILRSLAFGLGPSYATSPPAYEIASRDQSQQFMMYWMMEAEFGPQSSANSFFTRLHHRSGAFGTVADEGGSNVIVLGLRHRW